ncbi:cal-1, partial [Symbiodinium sp. CCMP2456]
RSLRLRQVTAKSLRLQVARRRKPRPKLAPLPPLRPTAPPRLPKAWRPQWPLPHRVRELPQRRGRLHLHPRPHQLQTPQPPQPLRPQLPHRLSQAPRQPQRLRTRPRLLKLRLRPPKRRLPPA